MHIHGILQIISTSTWIPVTDKLRTSFLLIRDHLELIQLKGIGKVQNNAKFFLAFSSAIKIASCFCSMFTRIWILILKSVRWSRGMILTSGVRDPGFDSQTGLKLFQFWVPTLEYTNLNIWIQFLKFNLNYFLIWHFLCLFS